MRALFVRTGLSRVGATCTTHVRPAGRSLMSHPAHIAAAPCEQTVLSFAGAKAAGSAPEQLQTSFLPFVVTAGPTPRAPTSLSPQSPTPPATSGGGLAPAQAPAAAPSP